MIDFPFTSFLTFTIYPLKSKGKRGMEDSVKLHTNQFHSQQLDWQKNKSNDRTLNKISSNQFNLDGLVQLDSKVISNSQELAISVQTPNIPREFESDDSGSCDMIDLRVHDFGESPNHLVNSKRFFFGQVRQK